MGFPSCLRPALLVAVAATSLPAETLAGDRFLLSTETAGVAYILELAGLQLAFSFPGDGALGLTAEASPAIAGWKGEPARIAEHTPLITHLDASKEACEGLRELLGRLKGSAHTRLHGAVTALLKATRFNPATSETKEEKKEAGTGALPTGNARVALPAGPLRIPATPTVSAEQRKLFNTHLDLASKAIQGQIDANLAAMTPLRRARFPKADLTAAIREYQNTLFASMAKTYPTKDISKPAGDDLEWLCKQAARTFMAALKGRNGLALELLGGDRPDLARALEVAIGKAFGAK